RTCGWRAGRCPRWTSCAGWSRRRTPSACGFDSVAGLGADRADLAHALRIPRRRAAVGVARAYLGDAGVAPLGELGAGDALGVGARAGAAVVAAHGLYFADALRVPRLGAAERILPADVADAGVAGGGERRAGRARVVGAARGGERPRHRGGLGL